MSKVLCGGDCQATSQACQSGVLLPLLLCFCKSDESYVKLPCAQWKQHNLINSGEIKLIWGPQLGLGLPLHLLPGQSRWLAHRHWILLPSVFPLIHHVSYLPTLHP